MAKIVVRTLVDITISDEVSLTPPYDRMYTTLNEIKAIIDAGCTEQGFSYERFDKTVLDDFADNVYELVES
jgi:hypothetical protein